MAVSVTRLVSTRIAGTTTSLRATLPVDVPNTGNPPLILAVWVATVNVGSPGGYTDSKGNYAAGTDRGEQFDSGGSVGALSGFLPKTWGLSPGKVCTSLVIGDTAGVDLDGPTTDSYLTLLLVEGTDPDNWQAWSEGINNTGGAFVAADDAPGGFTPPLNAVPAGSVAFAFALCADWGDAVIAGSVIDPSSAVQEEFPNGNVFVGTPDERQGANEFASGWTASGVSGSDLVGFEWDTKAPNFSDNPNGSGVYIAYPGVGTCVPPTSGRDPRPGCTRCGSGLMGLSMRQP